MNIYLIISSICLAPAALSASSLMSRSPFIPSDFTPPNQSSTPAKQSASNANNLKYRGMYGLNNRYFFLISKGHEAGSWTELGIPAEGITVLEFEEDEVLVDQGGQKKWLKLEDVVAPAGVTPTTTQQSSQKNLSPNPRVTRTTRVPSRRKTIRPSSSISRNKVQTDSGAKTAQKSLLRHPITEEAQTPLHMPPRPSPAEFKNLSPPNFIPGTPPENSQ